MKKVCIKCKEEKELVYFGKTYGKFRNYCKACGNKYFRDLYKNSESFRDKTLIRNRTYQKLHPEKFYYRGNGYKYVKERRKKIKEKYGFGGGFLWRYGLELLKQVFSKYEGKCFDCGIYKDLTIHHIDGRGRNLTNKGLKPNNKIDNLMLLCRKCHGSRDGKKKGKKKSHV